jgi:transcriptional regulator with XRE-family HTH domain
VKIGKRIRALRLEKNISQEKLASLSEIDRSYFGKWNEQKAIS